MAGTDKVPGGQIARWSWGMTLALLAWTLGTAPVAAGIGEVDVRFGNHGVLQIESAQGARVLQLSDGKLLSVDLNRDNLNRDNVEIKRYLASGAPDTTFGDAGVRWVQFPAKNEPVLGDAQLQSDGKIVLVGAGGIGTDQWVRFIARLDASGAIDATFGQGGIVNGGYAGDGFDGFGPGYSRVLALPGGELVAAVDDQGTRFLDRFAADGRRLSSTALAWPVVAMAAAPDDKVMLLGRTSTGGVLARLLRDGTPDPTFASGKGIDLPLTDALAVAADSGEVAICGLGELRRFTADGRVDERFGMTWMGRVRFADIPGLAGNRCDGIVLFEDGRVVTIASNVGGWGEYSSVTHVIAVDATGSLDARVGAGKGYAKLRGETAPGTNWRGASQWLTPNGDLRLVWQVSSLTTPSLDVEAIDLGGNTARGSVGIPGLRVRVMEQKPVLELPVVRSGPPSGPARVRYEVIPQTAAKDDFGALSGELTWTDGDGGTRTLSLPLVNDGRIEGEETVLVRLFDANGIDTPVDPFTVTIVDDDALRSLRFAQETITWTVGPAIPTSSWPSWQLILDAGVPGPVTAYFYFSNGIDGCCMGVLRWKAGESGARALVPYAGESLGSPFYVTVIDDDYNDAGPSANVKIVIEPTPPDNTSGGGASGGVGGGSSNGGAGGGGGGGSFGIVGALLLLALGTAVHRRRFLMLDARLQ